MLFIFDQVMQRPFWMYRTLHPLDMVWMDEDKRIVFTLKVFHQCSYEEIAGITGFSLPKLKTDLHRARAEMRKRISPYAGVGYEV